VDSRRQEQTDKGYKKERRQESARKKGKKEG
jgi:hypothetical protein